MIKKILLKLLWCYRKYISTMMLPHCRFFPTCSAYAEEALKTQPLLHALGKITHRLCRCHPFAKGGYDPI